MLPIFVKTIDNRKKDKVCPTYFILYTWYGFTEMVTDYDILDDKDMEFIPITPFIE